MVQGSGAGVIGCRIGEARVQGEAFELLAAHLFDIWTTARHEDMTVELKVVSGHVGGLDTGFEWSACRELIPRWMAQWTRKTCTT
jgi:hypothetical protein